MLSIFLCARFFAMKKEEVIRLHLGESAQIERQILGGMMNGSFLVDYQNKKYILYMPTEQANEMVDRKEEKRHLDIVYPLGITSKNVYFDVKAGIKINEFIEGESLNKLDDYDEAKIAKILRTLHDSPVKSNIDYLPFERFVGFEKEALEFSSLDDDYRNFKELLFANKDYLLSDPLVLSHNDFQKSNIVFNPNDNNYYMIDFEFMANNSPIYDIACFANNSVNDGLRLLKAYFGNPSLEETKKFYLWRIFISMQWYLVAIIKHYRGEGKAHQIDFLGVANFFMGIAKEAKAGLDNLK